MKQKNVEAQRDERERGKGEKEKAKRLIHQATQDGVEKITVQCRMTTYRAPLQHNPQREKGVRGVRPWERLENVRKERRKKSLPLRSLSQGRKHELGLERWESAVLGFCHLNTSSVSYLAFIIPPNRIQSLNYSTPLFKLGKNYIPNSRSSL